MRETIIQFLLIIFVIFLFCFILFYFEQKQQINYNIVMEEQNQKQYIANESILNKKQEKIFINNQQTELNCLTKAIYFEAGNQSELGKQAVAKVILNRVNHNSFSNTICGVISQSTTMEDKKICQFSFHCMNLEIINNNLWEICKNVAKKALTNNLHHDIITQLDSALYFHSDYVQPLWFKKLRKIIQIENHIFYGEKNGTETT